MSRYRGIDEPTARDVAETTGSKITFQKEWFVV
jgi:hypothetical protein